jgi:hypothetical protein
MGIVLHYWISHMFTSQAASPTCQINSLTPSLSFCLQHKWNVVLLLHGGS